MAKKRNDRIDGWCAGGVDRQLKDLSSSFFELDITGHKIRRL